MSAFAILEAGFVYRCPATAPPGHTGHFRGTAMCSRIVALDNGDLLCGFMLQSELAVADFLYVICRSTDGGKTWSDPKPIWPEWEQSYSIAGSISRDRRPGGKSGDRVYFFGSRYAIDTPGQSAWSQATCGLKQNDIIHAWSHDQGRTWSNPQVISMHEPGAAENPSPIWQLSNGTLIGCYSPYNTFNPQVKVRRNQVIALRSSDEGRTWNTSRMLSLGPDDGGAEAWVVELADGRLLGTSWHMNHVTEQDYPNAYALSHDGGATWTDTRSTGIRGQSCALEPLPDGTALMIYNRRKHAQPGVGLAHVNPTEKDFGILADEMIWHAPAATRDGTDTQSANQWTSFSFGEPSIIAIGKNEFLATLWCIEPTQRGIRYVRLKMSHSAMC